MVATDTIVGVTGAVLLAAVMVGVFVYEYNNTPQPGDDGDGGQVQTFASRYPLLDPRDDLDGDNVPNYKDPDMDGNGQADGNQTRLQVTITVNDRVQPAQTPTVGPSDNNPLRLWHGVQSVNITLSYDVVTPDPALPAAQDLSINLLDPGGESTASGGAATRQGSTATKTLHADAPTVGNNTVRVTDTSGQSIVPSTQAIEYTLAIVIDYGPVNRR